MAANTTTGKPPARLHELHASTVILGVLSVISLISSVLLCVMCQRPLLRLSPLFKWLLFCLTISDICLIACFLKRVVLDGYIFYDDHTCEMSVQCALTAFLSVVARMTSFAWTIAIGVCCTLTILKRLKIPESIFIRQAFLCGLNWCGPVIIGSIALSHGALGKMNTIWPYTLCWIRTCDSEMSKVEQLMWMLFSDKIWEYLAYLTIANVIFVGLCIRSQQDTTLEFPWAVTNGPTISTNSHSGNESQLSGNELPGSECNATDIEMIHNIKLFLWIPVVFLLCRIWGTIKFCFTAHSLFYPAPSDLELKANNVLEYFKVIGDGSHATCNLILVLIFHPESREWIKGLVTGALGLCRRHNYQNIEEEA